MSATNDQKLRDDDLKERMRERMQRMQGMIERVRNGEATESEIAEIKALDEEINSVPDDVIRG